MFWRYFRSNPAAIVGLIFLLLSPILVVLAVLSTRDVIEYGAEVYPVEGRVSHRQAGTGRQKPKAEVSFTDRDGVERRERVTLTRSEYRQTQVGDRFALYVSARDATKVWSSPPTVAGTLPFWIFAALMVLSGAGLTVAGARSASRRARVVTRGTPVQGRVVRIDEQRNAKAPNRVSYRAVYAWEAKGQRYEAKSPTLMPQLAQSLQAGGGITVYVDPARPQHGEIDVFGVRLGG